MTEKFYATALLDMTDKKACRTTMCLVHWPSLSTLSSRKHGRDLDHFQEIEWFWNHQ